MDFSAIAHQKRKRKGEVGERDEKMEMFLTNNWTFYLCFFFKKERNSVSLSIHLLEKSWVQFETVNL